MTTWKAFSVAVLAAASCAGHADSSTSTEPMQPSKASELLMSNDDKVFMTKAASANEYEVEAGQLALQKSTDSGVKTFAQQMIDDHTKASKELAALAMQKKTAVPASPDQSEQSLLDSLNKKPAGKDFDKAYCEQMTDTHKKAVSLFDNEARNGKDTEVKAWAAKTLPTLQKHGGMAKGLEKSS